MSEPVLLDTSVCIPLINRSDEALTHWLLGRAPGSVSLCGIVRAELEFGARSSQRVAENLARLEVFCRSFPSIGFDDVAAVHYGNIRTQLRREGRLIGGNDMLIAAIALAAEVPLATRNVDEFCRVPGLVVHRC